MSAVSITPDTPIGAVGAGRMGRGMAIAFAWAGLPVRLIDARPRDRARWQTLRDEIDADLRGNLAAMAALGTIDARGIEALMARIQVIGDPDADAAMADCPVIFEGVPETLEAKRQALGRIARAARPQAIIASTTSTMLSTELAAFVDGSQRFLNAHWLNPAWIIPIVEVSPHPGTDAAITDALCALLEQAGKVPVRCAAAPGYIVPRLQALIMNEAARMVEEGVASAEEIDKATRHGLGLRFAAIGVLEFIDFGGADILYHASRYLSARLDAGRYALPASIDAMMKENRLGLRTGQGFYDWQARGAADPRQDVLARTLGMLKHAGLYRPPAGGLAEQPED